MDALLLKSYALPHKQIAAILGIDGDTLRRHLRMYGQGGIEGLKAINWHQPQSELDSHQDTLKEEFLQHSPATVAEAGERIATLTGIRRKPTQIREFLKRLGMSPRKVAAVPSKADPQKQESFKKNS